MHYNFSSTTFLSAHRMKFCVNILALYVASYSNNSMFYNISISFEKRPQSVARENDFFRRFTNSRFNFFYRLSLFAKEM